MKSKLLFLVLMLGAQIVISQNCEDISPYTEGTRLEYTNYNKKGKVKSIENYIVNSVTKDNGALVIKLQSQIKKGKKAGETKEETLKCVDGNFFIDMSSYLSHQNENQESNLELKAVGDFLEFPDNLKEGTTLKDGSIALTIGDSNSSTEGFSFANMKVFNRKVSQHDSFTTKAGDFDAYKMSFDYLFNMGILKIRGSGIEWYVKGVGIIRTESYSKKGKLRWTRELTKFNK